jgi:hypothetical protein
MNSSKSRVPDPSSSTSSMILSKSLSASVKKCTDKKENKIFLIFREIQMGSGAKSYMRSGFLIYEDMHKYFHHV